MKAEKSDCAQRMKVLADDTRLAIIRALMSGPKCVSELNTGIGVEQSLLSHHLRILRDAKIVMTKRDGKSVRYRICPEVSKGARNQTIDLGCCTLSFN